MGTYAPATKCAHDFAEALAAATGAPFRGGLCGITSPVSRDCVWMSALLSRLLVWCPSESGGLATGSGEFIHDKLNCFWKEDGYDFIRGAE